MSLEKTDGDIILVGVTHPGRILAVQSLTPQGRVIGVEVAECRVAEERQVSGDGRD